MTVYHYCAWLLLLSAAIYQGLCVLRDTRHALAPNTIVIFGFLFIYVVSYLALDPDSKISFLSPPGYLAVLILACTSLVFFWLGCRNGRFDTYVEYPPPLGVRLTKIFAILLIGVALTGWFAFVSRAGSVIEFYSSVHGEAGKWTESSAYLYDLRLFLFPGLFWLFVLFLYRQASGPITASMILLVLFLGLEAWLLGSRGDWLRLLVLAGVPLLLLQVPRRTPKYLFILTTPLVIAFIVLTPYIRVATHLGADANVLDAARSALTEKSPLAGSTEGEGSELIVAAAVVQSARDFWAIDYGLAWLHPMMNFVPRFIWRDKPYYNEWSIDIGDLVQRAQGWRIAVGAAETGVADAFLRFGWLSPLVWLPLGFWGGRLYRKVHQTQNPLSAGYFTAYLIGLIYMVTQGFKAAFYAWFFFVIGVYGLQLVHTIWRTQRIESARISS